MADMARGTQAAEEGLDARLDLTPLPRRGAFRRAGRHSARVRFLRWTIVVGAGFGSALLALFAFFDPLGHLPKNISIGSVGVNGTRVTIDSPKLSGFRRDGRPYEVRAKAGIQDILKPNIIELVGVDARFGLADESQLRVTAANGAYDSTTDQAQLHGDVRFRNAVGYDFQLRSALLDLKGGAMKSAEPVIVLLNKSTITANTIDITDDGHKMTFVGDVKSLFESQDADSDAMTALTGPGK